jgi:hypothetical protein
VSWDGVPEIEKLEAYEHRLDVHIRRWQRAYGLSDPWFEEVALSTVGHHILNAQCGFRSGRNSFLVPPLLEFLVAGRHVGRPMKTLEDGTWAVNDAFLVDIGRGRTYPFDPRHEPLSRAMWKIERINRARGLETDREALRTTLERIYELDRTEYGAVDFRGPRRSAIANQLEWLIRNKIAGEDPSDIAQELHGRDLREATDYIKATIKRLTKTLHLFEAA